jgi:hypothetical protein
VSEENVEAVLQLASTIAYLQASDASCKSLAFAETLSVEPDTTAHPATGTRDSGHMCLLMLQALAEENRESSSASEIDFKPLEDLDPRPWVLGFAEKGGLTAEFPFTSSTRLTTREWANGRALTPMTIDQQPEGLSTPLPAVDWELYRRLKAEGRMNLLFHLSEAAAAGVQCAEAPTSRSNLLPFVSRAEHLAWRAWWKNGRWVKLSWAPGQRDAILRQDEAYRQADAKWKLNHGRVPGGASILEWRHEPHANRQTEKPPRENGAADEITQ